MTNRQLFNVILDNERTDHILWAARLDVWYNYLKVMDLFPDRLKNLNLYEIHKKLGIGFPQKSDVKSMLFTSTIKNATCYEEKKGDRLTKYIETPYGTVFDIYHVDEYRIANKLSFASTHIGYRLKDENDFKPIKYIIENTSYSPFYDHYYSYEEEIGEDGLTFFFTTNDPFSTIMRDYAGIEKFYYLLADYPSQMVEIIEILSEKLENELQPIMLECPARVAHHGGHYDSSVTPPYIYEKFILPYQKKFSDKLHNIKKYLALHTDADSTLLLNHMERAGMDLAECFCTYPMVAVSLKDAIDKWEDRIIIWGGIPSIILCKDSYSYEDFINYVNNVILLIKSRKCRVILGVSDNVMPETDIGRLEKITELVNKSNQYM